MVPAWVFDLSGLIVSAGNEAPALEVLFRGEGFLCGINIATGEVTSGERAVSQITGKDELFRRLIRGEVTLQSAYRAGSIQLTGDPEPFLRLSMVLDRATKGAPVGCG
jgi:hypothetical protein